MECLSLTNGECWAVAGMFVMMLFDIIAGAICAAIRGDFSSSVMREGMGHKLVMTLALVLAVTIQIISEHVPDIGVNVPLILPVCVYVIVMEIASVLETLKSTYPDIAGAKIFSIFNGKADGSDES